MSVEVEVKGLKELSDALMEMPRRIRGKALGAAVATGAALVRNAARAAAPVYEGDDPHIPKGAVKKSIMAWRRRGSYPEAVTYCVGVTLRKFWPRGGAKNPVKKVKIKLNKKTGESQTVSSAFWWVFQELGTSKQAAKPFIRPAWDQTQGFALRAIKLMLKKAVAIAAEQVPKYRG